ncbi:MAG: hypothetical protein ACJ74U_15665 [Jatrophihabitantaceae bacterium]
MTLTTTGLTNGGLTAHYQIQYESTLSTADGRDRANGLIATCEADYALMAGWFGGIGLTVGSPITVNLQPGSYASASWGPPIQLVPGAGSALEVVRYLLVSEVTEMFMLAQNHGWFGAGNEGSAGEGLSRFLAGQFLIANGLGVTEPGFALANSWMASPRADFVNNVDVGDHGIDPKTGCAILFIYYLHTQLGFSINQIVAAAAPELSGVYQNLTGGTADPFPRFKHILDSKYPGSTTIPGPNPDNPYPILDPLLPPRAEISVVSRSADHLDIFAADVNGAVVSAAWQPDFADGWHRWWQINGGVGASGAPVHAVSRSTDKLDIFVIGTDRHTYTAAWQPDFADGWHGWWSLLGGLAAPGAHLTAVSRSADKLDVFVIGTDGGVYTAAWQPEFADGWHGWWRIGNAVVPQGSRVHAVSRSADKLDIFVTDVHGAVLSAAWQPDFADGWHGWWQINGGQAAPGAAVTATVRSRDHLDIFVTGTDGGIYTAAWQPDFADGWHGWWRIGNAVAPQGAPVHAVSRSADKLDIFVTDVHSAVLSAAWQPEFADGWHGWWQINSGQAAPGAPVTAVSRSADKLDIFVVGTDGSVYTAAWQPDFADGWHGWWQLS